MVLFDKVEKLGGTLSVREVFTVGLPPKGELPTARAFPDAKGAELDMVYSC